VFACISPWNFPLAIFVGQVTGALAAGNAVVAKPAEQTPHIAARAVELLHEAGVPRDALALIYGGGETGAQLVTDARVAGVAFTGSTAVAKSIQRALAAREGAIVPLIAETGGQNAMIVDSSALLEQACDDIIISAFYSAGQRCSSLRVLYAQEEIADDLIAMLKGAMAQLRVGPTNSLSTDVGPVIDRAAQEALLAHIARMKKEAKGFYATPMESMDDTFVAPHLFEIERIGQIGGEKFGPVLHVIRFNSAALNQVVSEIHSTGYGLTFGLHSRIRQVAADILPHMQAGNRYVNRNMIGAVVGVQPFGGEGLSGTGPKAGGPHYLPRFALERVTSVNTAAVGGNLELLA